VKVEVEGRRTSGKTRSTGVCLLLVPGDSESLDSNTAGYLVRITIGMMVSAELVRRPKKTWNPHEHAPTSLYIL
jgi:hypothetical protein